jgi:hypothetical protein
MTQTLARSTRPGQLLTRILEEPALVASVQSLDARVLSKVINHIGLEDAGELVALATTDQLKTIFDEDLWRSQRPGQDETFDAARFGLWLEILLEIGEDFAAQKLTELDENLVTLALCRHLLVIDIDELALRMSGTERSAEDDLTDKALESCLYHEMEEYRLISKTHEAWDSIVSVLVAMDQEHHEHLRRLLERCCHLSSEYIEDNGGLFDVLTSEEMLESDVASDREDRRAGEGFVAASSAASFLNLARGMDLPEILGSPTRDPLTLAYFRAYRPATGKAPGAKKRSPSGEPEPDEKAARVAKLVEVLKEAEVLQEAHPPLLAEGGSGASSPDALFKRAILDLHGRDPDAYSLRMEELSYLGNVLVAGCSFAGRSFRPFEAAEAAVAVCNLGLEHLLANAPRRTGRGSLARRAAAVLTRQCADLLFRVGWSLLHRQVSRVAGCALEQTLDQRMQVNDDLDVAAQVARVAKAVRAAMAADKPWTARGKLDALDAVFDAPTLAAWKALLDECPCLPRLDPGREDRRMRPAGRETEFIATEEQVRRARALLERL